MYRLVVLDIDDTIVKREKYISPATRDAIRKVQELGINVTLASGRMHQAMLSTAAELNITLPLISCNGAMIRSGQEMLSCDLVDKTAAKEVIDFFNQKNKVLQMYTLNGLYSKEKCEKTWRLEQSEGLPCTLVDHDTYDSFHQKDLLKLLIRLLPEEVPDYRQQVNEHLGDRISAALSHEVYLEMTNKGVSKGSALSVLAQKLGFESGEIIAIGDSHNDKSMLEWAGLGIAMGNASQEVKLCADKITLSIDDDGVAAALQEYILC